MALLRSAIFAIILAIVARASSDPPTLKEYKEAEANQSAAVDAEKAKQKKRSAVHKVLGLFQNIRRKVIDDGDAEAESYNKFACFCKDTSQDKTDSISAGQEEQGALTTRAEELSQERDGLDSDISGLQAHITQTENRRNAAEALNEQQLAEYTKNAADLSAALEALQGALTELKTSKNPSAALIQAGVKTVREFALMADALGLAVPKSGVASLLQETPEESSGGVAAPDVPMEHYNFHSDHIIETLDMLMKSFRQMKTELDAEEVRRVHGFTSLTQTLKHDLDTANARLNQKMQQRMETISDIESTHQRLSVVSATLLDDKTYLNELNEMCSKRAHTWDQRSRVRQEEIASLTQAIGVIAGVVKNKTIASTVRFVQSGVTLQRAKAIARTPAFMEALEVEAEGEEQTAAPGFLQRVSLRRHAGASRRGPGDTTESETEGRQTVVALLRQQGARLHSALLTSVATQVAADDTFAKVKVLIQELITRLLAEESREGTQKSWCDKSTAAATQRRDYAEAAVEKLNAKMAGLEATRDKLNEEIGVLRSQISDLERKYEEAKAARNKEHEENTLAISEADVGRQAVKEATRVLFEFYGTKAKETVTYSLSQRGPAGDAPDAGFEAGEAYLGAQSEWGGIQGLLEVIRSDFERTISETTAQEKEAAAEFFKFQTASRASVAEKKQAKSEFKSQRDAAVDALAVATEEFNAEVGKLASAIKELLELKAVCIDTGMSYSDRVARREDEIAALNKALCILEAYEEYGPGGIQGTSLATCQ